MKITLELTKQEADLMATVLTANWVMTKKSPNVDAVSVELAYSLQDKFIMARIRGEAK